MVRRVFLLSALCALLLQLPTASPAEAATFPDVPKDSFFEGAVAWGISEGLTKGYGSTGRFMPWLDITRAELITMIWRAADQPTPSGPLPADVPWNHFAAPAIRWGLAEGITTGVSGTDLFAPDRPITRAETVTMLWRTRNKPASNISLMADVPTTHFAAGAVRWAIGARITSGVGNTGMFAPDRPVTRAEAITFLWRLETGASAPLPSGPPPHGPHAFAVDLAGRPGPGRWDPCAPIYWHVDYTNADANARRVVPAAITMIERRLGIDYRQTNDPDAASLWISWRSEQVDDDLQNNPGAVGYARYAHDGGSSTRAPRIYAAEVVIREEWTPSGQDFGGHNSLGTLMLHELGHTAGLAHVGADSQVMYPYIRPLADYATGDVYGLYHLGRTQGCLSPAMAVMSADEPAAPDGPVRGFDDVVDPDDPHVVIEY